LSFTSARWHIVLFTSCCWSESATSAISTLSLHDALPICDGTVIGGRCAVAFLCRRVFGAGDGNRAIATTAACRTVGHTAAARIRSEEHTSELQSREKLVCRLLLEKKNNQQYLSNRV